MIEKLEKRLKKLFITSTVATLFSLGSVIYINELQRKDIMAYTPHTVEFYEEIKKDYKTEGYKIGGVFCSIIFGLFTCITGYEYHKMKEKN